MGPYRAVADVQEDLLRLLGPVDYVGEAGGLLRRHTVVGEAALESGSLHTWRWPIASHHTVKCSHRRTVRLNHAEGCANLNNRFMEEESQVVSPKRLSIDNINVQLI